MPIVEIDSKELENVVDFIDTTMPLLKSAEDAAAAAQAVIPDTVDTLIKAGYLRQNQRQNAIDSLGDPVNALESLRKIAESRINLDTAPAPAAMGKSATTTPSAVPQVESADDGFLRGFGLKS